MYGGYLKTGKEAKKRGRKKLLEQEGFLIWKKN